MSFGWAYVDCTDIAVTSMMGPSGSILVKTGTFSVTGSNTYKYLKESGDNQEANAQHSLLLTGSLKLSGSANLAGTVETHELITHGDLLVKGNLTATSYNVVSTTITEVQASGSTNFGSDANLGDKHTFSGSLVVAGGVRFGGTGRSLDHNGYGNRTFEAPSLCVSASTGASQIRVGVATGQPPTHLAVSGAISSQYRSYNESTTAVTLSITASLVGITNTSAVTVNLPAAQGTPGRTLFIKDEAETQPRTTGNKITVSPNGTDTIDGQTSYYIMGSRAALSLYSNGKNKWFVF